MKAVIVADSNEINKFTWEVKETKLINQFDFTVFENDVIFVHCGIGIANAAAATQALIDNFDIEAIYNYGAVGASHSLNIFDVVIPRRIYYHDVTTPWYQRGQTPGEEKYYENSLSQNGSGNLGSGSSFITDGVLIEKLEMELGVKIFDMETAGIAQIAHKNGIPIKVVKVVSDIIGKNDISKEDINERIKQAAHIAFEELLKCLG